MGGGGGGGGGRGEIEEGTEAQREGGMEREMERGTEGRSVIISWCPNHSSSPLQAPNILTINLQHTIILPHFKHCCEIVLCH